MHGYARCCRGCGADISHRARRAKWCSEACRVRAFRDRNPGFVERQREVSRQRHAANYQPVGHPPTACRQCNETFTPNRVDQVFCSRNCSNNSLVATAKRRTSQAKDRAGRRGLEVVDGIDVGDVFERSGWICGLCDDPVDQDLRYPDPLSASLDHIVPGPFGGRHEDSNVQLAHLVCNKRKGNQLI